MPTKKSAGKNEQKRPRETDGSVYSKTLIRVENGRKKKYTQWFARVRYKDANTGQYREKKRRADSKDDALVTRRELREEIAREATAAAAPPADKTFAEIAEWYETEYLQPPRFVGDVKVAGLSSYGPMRSMLKPLVAAFGDTLIRDIKYEDLRTYKADRLRDPVINILTWKQQQPKISSKPRNAASVHRELALLRVIFNRSKQRGWLDSNPFSQGDTLIALSAEVDRMRILTRAEERDLLAQCVGPREHLRPAIICAIDTGLRKNEQFTLTWANVDLEGRSINLRARNAKRGKKRTVPISARLLEELATLREATAPTLSDRIFPRAVKTAFATAMRNAGIEGFTWHDLRHTALTWMVESGLDPATIMRIAGHSKFETTMKYINTNAELTKQAADRIDARRARVS